MPAKTSDTIAQRIESVLARFPKRTFKVRELFRETGLPSETYTAFKETLRRLADEGRIARAKGNRFGLASGRECVEGILHVKTQGYGFLIQDDGGPDVFISQRNMGSALHHDRVRVELWAQPIGRLPEGKVVEVLSRGRERIVGMFQEGTTYGYVIPDELKITRDVFIAEENRGGAKPGHKVVVEILDWGDSARMPEGRVVSILGYPDEPDVDVLSVMHAFDLPERFPPAVEREAKGLDASIPEEEIARRRDLRDLLVFTIDPDDAKDFDDAVSLERLPDGRLRLGVHIADVSHYVRPGMAMDREALRRGTSVYLVDRVVPMLPERLSNLLCSLRPDEDRMAYSVILSLTPEGERIDYEIQESLIRSRYRLTYRQAQDILDGKASGFPETLIQTLQAMRDLSRRLFARWRVEGSIDFDAPEPQVILDARGKPMALGVRERLESHRLIEAFMLLANRTVAEHVHRLRQKTGRKFRFVYRVHEKPTGKKLDQFLRFVRAMGYAYDPGKKPSPLRLQRFLDSLRGTPHETVIKEVALRSMMKAQYDTANIGHFGLAFRHYTHFTSPIRRYPDLIVHQLLKAYASGRDEMPCMAASLGEICKTATEREIVAMEAERESIRAKQVAYMAERVGEEFDALISGVTSFGFFAEIPNLLVDGLVHVEDLKDDYYLFDEDRLRLVGERTRRIFKLGDPVRVRVARVLKDLRKIDFVLVEEGPVTPSRPRRGKRSKKG